MINNLQKFGLDFNPFEPAATGSPLTGELCVPRALVDRMRDFFDIHQSGQGVKGVVIVGDYGSGKTCLLQWLHREIFPGRRIKSFYFDNPGVHFYDLANALLRTIGRKDFAKFIWELARSHLDHAYQGHLFQENFEEYLHSIRPRQQQRDLENHLQKAIITATITPDEEIAHCLARIVTDSIKKPYFEYRDFVPRQTGSVVPESEEAPYFRAILQTLSEGINADGVAFLIDEFEEIGLQKRLTKRAAHDYLATMKRLINLAHGDESNFWIALSMTRDAYQTTRNLEPALAERFSDRVVDIRPLDRGDAAALMRARINTARTEETDIPSESLFPFPDKITFNPTTYSNPRRLVKTCFLSLARASEHMRLPFSEDYLRGIEEDLYPSLNQFDGARQ